MAIDALKILAIDDNPDNLITLKAVVRDALPEATVVTALSGAQGLALARAEDPDVILLDIVMPEMDGYAVCRALKADDRLRHIPVVFLTALRADREGRIRALEAGAEAFLAKPLDEVELSAQIRAMAKIKAANQVQRLEREQLTARVAERTRELDQELAERKRAEVALRESEARYRAIFENMTAACCVDEVIYENGQAVDYRILDVNPAFERITGIPRSQAAGALASVVYGLGKAPYLDIYSKVAETGMPAVFETYFAPIQKDLYITVGSPGPGRFSTVFSDITERKQAEETLREREANLQKAQAVANVGSWVWHIRTNRLVWSDQMYRIFGIEQATFTGDLVDVIARAIHPADRPAVEESNLSVINDRKPIPLEYRVIWPDGTVRVVWAEAGELILDDAGNPRTLSGIVQDITERKQAAQHAFELALERERVRLLTRFIQDASHEFRTPLSIIQTNVYLLERLEDPAKRQRKLTQIGDQVTGLTRLVELLAEITRLDSDAPFTTAPTDLNLLVGAVAGQLQGAVATAGLTLHQALAPDLPPIPAHAGQLGKALHELLANAVRFTPTGGRVTVRTAGAAAGVTVEVEDTGPGIPPDVLPHIFERFYRRDVAHTTPGFGLGLPIARAIVERHGGRLEVESQPGAGSVFRIRLLTIDD